MSNGPRLPHSGHALSVRQQELMLAWGILVEKLGSQPGTSQDDEFGHKGWMGCLRYSNRRPRKPPAQ
jgi:hypothetical protein